MICNVFVISVRTEYRICPSRFFVDHTLFMVVASNLSVFNITHAKDSNEEDILNETAFQSGLYRGSCVGSLSGMLTDPSTVAFSQSPPPGLSWDMPSKMRHIFRARPLTGHIASTGTPLAACLMKTCRNTHACPNNIASMDGEYAPV
jgi:hypothetical protein